MVAQRAATAWVTTLSTTITPTGVVAAGFQEGDRVFLLLACKDYSNAVFSISNGAGVTWTPCGPEYADGTVVSGNGTGSVMVVAYYADVPAGGLTGNPVVTMANLGNVVMAACVVGFSKGAGETWDTPSTRNGAMASASVFTVTASASSTLDVGDLVIGLVGIRDDSATFARTTTQGIGPSGISGPFGAGGVSDYVELPATHASTTLGNDMAADAGYRIVATAGTYTLDMGGQISANETGAALWIIQGVTASGGAFEPSDPMGASGFFGL